MTRDPRVYVDDILESIDRIEEYVGALDERQFMENVQIQDAVMRRLEIIGEAVKNIPESVRQTHPDIPWRSVAGLRDVLIHGYFRVNMHRTWLVAKEDVPEFRQKLIRLRDKLADYPDAH